MSKWIIALVLLLGTSSELLADEYTWKLRKDQDNVVVYTRKVEGSSIAEFKGITTVNASIDEATSFFDQDDMVSKWFFYGLSPQLIEGTDASQKIYYLRVDLPWPLRDRDIIFKRIKSSDDKTKEIKYILTSTPKKVPLKKGVVRVLQLSGMWRFIQLPDGRTEIYFQQHANPRAFFAPVVINQMLVDIPFDTLKNFSALLEQRRK